MQRLTSKDYADAARKLKCSPEALIAVSIVESGGRSGFDDNNRLLIRFEGHVFRKLTNGRFDRTNPEVSYPYAQRHGKPHQYSGFNIAFGLDPHAAMMATSYGLFQQMGFNHDEMGFDTVEEMVDSFKKGEREQLDGFVNIIIKWGLADELRRATFSDFTNFAKRYNGADYKSNRYDEKMYSAYKRLSGKKKTDKESEEKEEPALIPVSENPIPVEPAIPVNPPPVNETPTPPTKDDIIFVAAPAPDNATSTAAKTSIAGIVLPGFIAVIFKTIGDLVTTGYVSASQIGEFVMNLVKENQKYVIWLVLGIIALLMLKKLTKQIIFGLSMLTRSIRGVNSIQVVAHDDPRAKGDSGNVSV
jgi:hypothetical protein